MVLHDYFPKFRTLMCQSELGVATFRDSGRSGRKHVHGRIINAAHQWPIADHADFDIR